jgi:4-amino-4-deoxy-L-arabinose transferase-like glycosyltransferase
VSRPRVDRFGRVLFAIALLALTVRVTYVLWGKGGECLVTTDSAVVSSPTECPGGGGDRANDAVFYNAAANHLARGGGLTDPFRTDRPAADHPPLTVLVLAPVSWVGDHIIPKAILDDLTNVFLHRLTMAGIGTLVVVGVGLLGRRVGGERAGVLAAGIAAVYPGLWISDGLIFAEPIANLMVVVVLLLALGARDHPSARRFAVLGVAIALATLARAELLLLAPWFAVFAFVRRDAWRWRQFGAIAAGIVVLLGPWVAYNNSRFEEFTLISTNDGLALAASNCDPVYHDRNIGLTSYLFAPEGSPPEVRASAHYCIEHPDPPGDQSEVSRFYRARALDVIRDDLAWQPIVMSARVGRVWNLFRPLDMIWYNEGEDRESWATRAALYSFYPVALAAILGARTLRRRRDDRGARDLLVLLAPIVVVTIAAALTYGQARYRSAAEPALVVLAALAIASWRPADAP